MANPNEIWELIDSIMADGELSETEIFDLANWLEDNPECRKELPGRVLASPVKRMVAGGKVTTMDMRRIGKLLVDVQKRRSKELISAEKNLSAGSVSEALQGFNPLIPALPSIPISADVPSAKDSQITFEVDLSWPKCNCQTGDGTSNLPKGHLNRCCEHVLAVYAMIRPAKGWPGWLESYLGSSWRPAREAEWFIIPGPPPILFSISPSEWCDVYAPKRTVYDRFGFSRLDERWSYGEMPKDARLIEEALLGFIRPWEQTPQGKVNMKRMLEKKAAKQAAKAAAAQAEQLAQIAFLTEAGFSCGNLSPEEIGFLHVRVLRPVDYAIRQTFQKVEEIIETELRPLRFAILAWDYCPNLPRYGPQATWEVLNAGAVDPGRPLSTGELCAITNLAAQVLPPNVFLALSSNGVKRHKTEVDTRIHSSLPVGASP